MIPSIDIRNALSDLLKRHFPYTIYFTNNANAKQGYFHIKIAPKKRMVDRVIYDARLMWKYSSFYHPTRADASTAPNSTRWSIRLMRRSCLC